MSKTAHTPGATFKICRCCGHNAGLRKRVCRRCGVPAIWDTPTARQIAEQHAKNARDEAILKSLLNGAKAEGRS